MEVNIKDKCYTLAQKPADRYGILRFDLVEKGSDAKPYSISFDPLKYKDSIVPGWGCSCKGWIIKKGEIRNCKHVVAMAQLYPHKG